MNIISIISLLILPAFIIFVIIYGLTKKVKVYDAFCRGAKDGLELVGKILPFICAMVIAIGILRDSGLLGLLSNAISAPLSFIGVPPEIISLYLIRPFSGSASIGMLVDIFNSTGINSLTSDIASTMMGSSETTFYTIALYFGSIGVKKTRYAVVVAVICDLVTMLTAVLVCRMILT